MKKALSTTKTATTVTRAKRGTAAEEFAASKNHSNSSDDYSSTGSSGSSSGETLVTFERFGAPKLSGKITPGSKVKIKYDYHRLLDDHPECIRRTPNGDIGEIQMGVKFDNEPSKIQYVKFVAGYSHAPHYKVPIENAITVPKNAKKVEIWFSTGGPLYNFAFDSNYNKNYVFDAKE